MKTEFPIFWIDDNQEFIDYRKSDIESCIEDYGLILKCVTKNKYHESHINEIKKMSPYLVLLDYNLGEIDGHAIIKKLRDEQLYYDILFYTQDGFSNEEITKFCKNGWEHISGVHFGSKKVFATLINNIVSTKMEQVSDIATQRGWIVADAIELQSTLNDRIMEIAGYIGPVMNGMSERILGNGRTDFGCRIGILNGLLKDMIKHLKGIGEPCEELEKSKKELSTFSEEIVEIRNSIAHQQHNVDSLTGRITIRPIQSGKSEIEWTQETLSEIRRNFHKHHTNLQEIHDGIALYGKIIAMKK